MNNEVESMVLKTGQRPADTKGFLDWMIRSGKLQKYNHAYQRYIEVIERNLSSILPAYASLHEAWEGDRFRSLHSVIDKQLLGIKNRDRFHGLFGRDKSEYMDYTSLRTAVEQYSRFIRGVSPDLRGRADYYRDHLIRRYVEPARKEGKPTVTIKTDDVIDELAIYHDKVYVSEVALEPKFLAEAEVEYDGEMPRPRASLEMHFRFIAHSQEDYIPPLKPQRKKIMRPPSLNQVFYGPPGTGKTYRTSQEAVRICDGNVSEDRTEYMARYKELLERGRIEFVTFHQSFSYEDFVEGLRPDVLESSEIEASGGFKLRVRNGVFKKIERRARIQGKRKDDLEWTDEDHSADETFLGRFDSSNKNLPYVLIIDELNRANISKVLGELITLLEEDKRIGKDNEISVQLPYSGKQFGVASNLYIVGTMNTADRSIALLDTALRRRFEFHEIMPDPSLLKVVAGINLPKLLTYINENIVSVYDRDHQIGHSHFMKCKSREDVEYAFRRHVIPLLNEYFYNRGEEVASVLGDKDRIDQNNQGVGNFMRRTSIGDEGKVRWSVRSEDEGLDFAGFEQ